MCPGAGCTGASNPPFSGRIVEAVAAYQAAARLGGTHPSAAGSWK